MKVQFTKSLLAAMITGLLVTGCGGGGSETTGDGGPPPPAALLTGQFFDHYVQGLGYSSDSGRGQTNAQGEFYYGDSEAVRFSVGSINLGAVGGKPRVYPTDFSADETVVAMMMALLQNLDRDRTDGVITIDPELLAALENAVGELDFESDPAGAVAALEANLPIVIGDAGLPYITPDEAFSSFITDVLTQLASYETNVSRQPEMATDKAGIEIFDNLVPARDKNGNLVDTNGDGTTGDEVHPMMVAFKQAATPEGQYDVFVAVSYDNGITWKSTNLSQQAGLETNVLDKAASTGGPNVHVEGDLILISWESTYCQGSPFKDLDGDGEGDLVGEGVINPAEPYLAELTGTVWEGTDDLFRVLGKQGIVDYTDVYPDVGQVPFHCAWTIRGVLNSTDEETGAPGLLVDYGYTGEAPNGTPYDDAIVWFKPQQLTSGVRDAKLTTPAGVAGAGFALAWQEDPDGLLPGQGEGPGVGWSGATTHHKTDIWYSFISWSNFINVADDSDPTVSPWVKAGNNFSVPIPVSDNRACNLSANNQDSDTNSDSWGAACTTETFCATTTIVQTQIGTGGDSTAEVCVTADGSILDGDVAASRPNLAMVAVVDETGEPVTVCDTYDTDGTTCLEERVEARALLMYEETKGICVEGKGCDDYEYQIGKWIVYHHMPAFADPGDETATEQDREIVASGAIVSEPVGLATTDPFGGETFDNGTATAEFECPFDADGDGEADTGLCYENARRERFTINSDPSHPVKMAMIYKQGYYKQGERADIFMRRFIGGWEAENLTDDMCVSCVSVTASEDETLPDYSVETVVTEWQWDPEDVVDESWTNPYDDARSLRTSLDGDRLLVGYAWTPNWKLATTSDAQGYFKDHYDFMVRRSFDSDADNLDLFFEGPLNTSRLADTAAGTDPSNPDSDSHKVGVVEPRLATLGVPLTCSSNSADSCYVSTAADVDTETAAVADKFVVTYCTAENMERIGPDGRPVHAPGLDCFYSWTQDDGETWVSEETIVVDGEEVTVPLFECLACDKAEEVEPEVVLTVGSSSGDENVVMEMHAAWVKNGDLDDAGGDINNGSDAWYGLFELSTETEETTTTE